MKDRREIEMDFSRALSQAQELEMLSKELSSIATYHIAEALRVLKTSWQGDNSELFNEKGEVLSTEILETADDLIKVARNISVTAGVIYKAEKQAMQVGFYS